MSFAPCGGGPAETVPPTNGVQLSAVPRAGFPLSSGGQVVFVPSGFNNSPRGHITLLFPKEKRSTGSATNAASLYSVSFGQWGGAVLTLTNRRTWPETP